jgi:hypothetical protein
VTRIALIAVGLLVAAAIAWDAAERHYNACVNAPKVSVVNTQWGSQYATELSRRVNGCSRLP